MRLNRKNKLLIGGFIVVLFISYKFAIANTLAYYNEYSEQSDLAGSELLNPNLNIQLLQKEKQLDSVIATYNIANNDSFQNDLLKLLSKECNQRGLRVTDFKEPHIYTDSTFTASSYSFTVRGPYSGSLQLLNSIENNPGFGNVEHVSFLKKFNYKANDQELFMEVVLQRRRG